MPEWKNGIAEISLPTPFPVGDINVFLLNADRLTLVDAGPKTKEAWEAFSIQLKEINLKPQDIEQVILTHHHPDHAGMLDFFDPSLEVYGHHLNERWLNRTTDFLEQHDAFYRRVFAEFGIPDKYLPFIERMKKTLKFSCTRSLTGALNEGDQPAGLDAWQVIETPGHARSHISLWRETDGAMIGGDLLLAHISSNPILEPPLPGESARPKPQLQYNHSLKKMLDYPISCVYPGHGPAILNVNELVQKRLERQHDRAMQVKKWLEQEALTVFEICQRLFPAVYERELSLTISETVAQIDYLDALGEIVIIQDNHTNRYQAK